MYLFIIPIEEYLKNSTVPRIKKRLEKKFRSSFAQIYEHYQQNPTAYPKKKSKYLVLLVKPFKSHLIYVKGGRYMNNMSQSNSLT